MPMFCKPKKQESKKVKVIKKKKYLNKRTPFLFSIITSVLTMLAISSLVFFPDLFTSAATITITQTDWSGGANPGATTTSLSGWGQFDSQIDTDYILSSGEIKINENYNQWGLEGTSLVSALNDQEEQKMIPDNAGGTITTWTDNRSGNYDVYAQRIDANGNTLWTVNGVVVCNDTNYQTLQSITSDSNNGAIIAWTDRRNGTDDIYAQRIDNNGNTLWATNGVAISISSGSQMDTDIVSDSMGGAIITWTDNRSGNGDIYTQRIDNNGNTLWATNGVAVCTATGNQRNTDIVSDSMGGAIITWTDNRSGNGDIYAQRIDNNGNTLWATNGVAVCNNITEQNFDEQNFPLGFNNNMVADDSGGAIIAWYDYRNDTQGDIYAQRIDANGNTLWTVNGVAVCSATGSQFDLSIASDNNDGAIITWNDRRSGNYDIYAQRIDNNGSAVWTANGVAACDNTDGQYCPTITSDSSGNSFIVWNDYRDSNDLYAQKIDVDGNVLLDDNGILVFTDSNVCGFPRIIYDNLESYIITWYNCDNDISAQKMREPTINQAILTSSTFDTQTKIVWNTLDWQGNIPIDSSITFETRTSNDNSNWSSWINNGIANTGSSGSFPISSPIGRYIQYRVTLDKTNTSPTLSEIILSGTPPDTDGDSVPDYQDNCKYDSNPGQENSDGSKILIVSDDDADYEDGTNGDDGTGLPYYSSALSNLGYSYDTWTESIDGEPALNDLQSYDAVIWTCGDFYDQCPSSSDASMLQDFTDQGGKLLISGAWILYDWDYDNFAYNILHALDEDWSDSLYDIKVNDASHPIADGFIQDQVINFGLSPTGANFGYSDVIGNITQDYQDDTTNYSIPVFVYGPNSDVVDEYAIVAYEDSISNTQIVYSSFPTYMWPETEGNQFINNIMDWFGLNVGDDIGDVCDICPLDPDNLCDPDAGQDMVCSDGGSVEAGDGEALIEVPAGAVNDCEPIGLEEGDSNFEITGSFGTMMIVSSYNLAPSGINFNNDITVTLYYNSLYPATRVFYSSDGGITWQEHNNVIDSFYDSGTGDGYITFLTDHFSTFGLGFEVSSQDPSAYTIPKEIGEEISEELVYDTYSITPYTLLGDLADQLGTSVEELIELNRNEYPCLGLEEWILRYIEGEIEEEAEEEITPLAPPSEPSYSVYTVQPGDYLIKIATKLYGNPYRWGELVELNKNNYPTLVQYPGSIEIGWRLRY